MRGAIDIVYAGRAFWVLRLKPLNPKPFWACAAAAEYFGKMLASKMCSLVAVQDKLRNMDFSKRGVPQIIMRWSLCGFYGRPCFREQVVASMIAVANLKLGA